MRDETSLVSWVWRSNYHEINNPESQELVSKFDLHLLELIHRMMITKIEPQQRL